MLDHRLFNRLIFTAMNSGLTSLARTGFLDEERQSERQPCGLRGEDRI